MSDPTHKPKPVTPPERKELWVPPSIPLPDMHEMRNDEEGRMFDPSLRGGGLPPETSEKHFSVFIRALHEAAREYNEALASCKKATEQPDYDEGCKAVRAASRKFVLVVADSETYKHVPEETFIDPVLNNGYIMDLHVIAEFTGIDLHDTHSSSMVSLISGSSSGSGG